MREWVIFLAALCLLNLATEEVYADGIPDSCRQTAGAKKASQYVKDCLYVTTASRPPCNSLNPCDLIIGHIQYMCGMADWKYARCKPYRNYVVGKSASP
jgi:hypothetical protein